jgi:hypothetical protein
MCDWPVATEVLRRETGVVGEGIAVRGPKGTAHHGDAILPNVQFGISMGN